MGAIWWRLNEVREDLGEFLFRLRSYSDLLLSLPRHAMEISGWRSRKMFVSKVVCFFLARRSNDWGSFCRVCEWRQKEKNRFIIIPTSEDCFDWWGLIDIL